MKQTTAFHAIAGLLVVTVMATALAQPALAQQQRQQAGDPPVPAQPEPSPARASQPEPVPDTGQTLPEIRLEATGTPGAIFVDPERVSVKPPILKALIQLNARMSPYQLDADSASPVNLRDVLKFALSNNLPIKISHADSQLSKWQYVSALGGFLPSIANGFVYEELKGKFASPFGVLVPISNNPINIKNEITQYFFKGGQIVFGSLEQKHNYRAAVFSWKGTINDMLLDATKLYYDMVLNDVLLQIRIKAVEVSKALLDRNEIKFANGDNTKLDVLQARTQLSRDRQHLIKQQIERRKSAVNLSTALNLDTSVDLTPKDRFVSKITLVDPNLKVSDLLQIAIDSRPELKKYDQLRLAAKAAIKVALAPLLPSVSGTLGQIATGAKVAPPQSQNLSISAASTGSFAGGSFGASSPAAIATGSTSSSSTPRTFTMTDLIKVSLSIDWTIGGLGIVNSSNVQSAKWAARKALLEFNQELAKVYQEVRDSYLDCVEAENQIIETTDAVNSSREQLEVATVRLTEGVGTDLEVTNAQRDYTDAMIRKAKAIVEYNTSQASLLRAMGRISLDTLTSVTPLRR